MYSGLEISHQPGLVHYALSGPGRPSYAATPQLPQAIAAACEVGDLGAVRSRFDGFVVRRARLRVSAQPAQPAQQVATGRVVRVMPGQLALEPADGRQCDLR